MKNPILYTCLALSLVCAVIFLISCVPNGPDKRRDAVLSAVREKIALLDLAGVEREGIRLSRETETADAGRYALALAAHLSGKYEEAIRNYDLIKPDAPEKKLIVEAIIWSHIHLGDIEGALDRLDEARDYAFRDKSLEIVLNSLRTSPMSVDIPAIVELPFTEDGLTPYLPGIDMMINGKRTVARIDTGGTYVHVSRALAEDLGIKVVAKAKSWASLVPQTIGYGFADIDLGSARIAHVPVAVHEKGLDLDPVAAAFGVELGPLIGTNILEQFLSTIDGPGKRLILSARRDPDMRARHEALLHGDPISVPFALWLDHLMIASGSVNVFPSSDDPRRLHMFFDSGLLALDRDGKQASMLVPVSRLESWNIPITDIHGGELPGLPRIGIGAIVQDDAIAYPVGERTWKNFGDWGGVRVEALLSWGFLKELTWTLDFDERKFLFRR